MVGYDARMTQVTRLGAFCYLIALLTAAADQSVKAWIISGLELPVVGSISFWGPIRFTLVRNQGVSFGFLQGTGFLARWLLVIFSLSVVIALAIWIRGAVRLIRSIGVGLIIGGAIGNLVDRARYGSVIDFIDAQKMFFPWVFNLADTAITIGIGLLILESVRTPAKRDA